MRLLNDDLQQVKSSLMNKDHKDKLVKQLTDSERKVVTPTREFTKLVKCCDEHTFAEDFTELSKIGTTHFKLPDRTKRSQYLKLQAELSSKLQSTQSCKTLKPREQQHLLHNLDVDHNFPDTKVILRLIIKYEKNVELCSELLKSLINISILNSPLTLNVINV